MKAFMVTDTPFNRDWHENLIGRVFDSRILLFQIDMRETNAEQPESLTKFLNEEDRPAKIQVTTVKDGREHPIHHSYIKMMFDNGWTVVLTKTNDGQHFLCDAWDKTHTLEEAKKLTPDGLPNWLNKISDL